jgi:CHRD domain
MSVIRRLLAVLVLAGALVAVLAVSPASAQAGSGCTLATALKPGNEVPVSNSMDFGAAVFYINGGTLKFLVVIANVSHETFVAGHIHLAPVGVAGRVVVPLFASAGVMPFVFTQSGTVSIDPALGAAICATPSAYYVNYHTTAHPSGTTRGQLG